MSSILRTKCLIIGESTVGKTSITKLLTNTVSDISNGYRMTRGIEVSVKKFRTQNNESEVELFLYDCSGKQFYQPIYETILSHNISTIVAVFDVTNEQTLNSLHQWLTNTLKTISKDSVIGVILGNKIDLEERVIVSKDEAHLLAKKFKMRYFETSAKHNIDTVFIK
ncbi:intraflagellar transport protein 27 homolog [Oppia nitens]|uniref:intraflagellar transport protein 27 homolog n=1 Tax=Oppia nitens TaxID=1686743 RepID=UPI0023D9B6F4|nr:intraflagellar transport protein 27 homolog [Oppia nitens]